VKVFGAEFPMSKLTPFEKDFSENRVALNPLVHQLVFPIEFEHIESGSISKHSEDLASLRLSFNEAGGQEFGQPSWVMRSLTQKCGFRPQSMVIKGNVKQTWTFDSNRTTSMLSGYP